MTFFKVITNKMIAGPEEEQINLRAADFCSVTRKWDQP
jgi:hypothetical protein